MNKSCTVYRTVDIIGRKWCLLVLLELCKGDRIKRYSAIRKRLPDITPKVLSARLKELEKEGLVKKRVYAQSPLRCEYCLTESGEDIIRIIKGIKEWALKWKIKNKICEGRNCKNCSL